MILLWLKTRVFQDATKAKLLEKSKSVLVAFLPFLTLENSF